MCAMVKIGHILNVCFYCDQNVPTNYKLPILNDHPNVTTMCNPITGWLYFECTQCWDHLALLVEHVDSIQNMLPEVSQMCLVITFRMYLKCNQFSGLYSECCHTSQCV